jgi:hypothetical protein
MMNSPPHNIHTQSHYLHKDVTTENMKPFNYRNFSVSQTSSKESAAHQGGLMSPTGNMALIGLVNPEFMLNGNPPIYST